jgi:hypothetical protein
MEIRVRNVNEALYRGLNVFHDSWGKLREGVVEVRPRGSPTLEYFEPVTTIYRNPKERVLFDPVRDANPFFHFFEALWMLAGRNDVAFLEQFVPRMREFSDNGTTFNAAYGHRWRAMWYDQLPVIQKLLRDDSDTRRAVLNIWGPMEHIASHGSKDYPCNTQVYFKLRDDVLRMTVTCRSNDMLWGAYGANCVHFSFLHEYMADKVSARVGSMYQVSDSFHVYQPPHPGGILYEKLRAQPWRVYPYDPYTTGEVGTTPLGAYDPDWDNDLKKFFQLADEGCAIITGFSTRFFGQVVAPLWKAWKFRDPSILSQAAAPDWRMVCEQWFKRRAK